MKTFRAGFLFCGLGAGARGFLQARAHLGEDEATFVSVGGIDSDPEACADFRKLTGSPALCADVATLAPSELRAAWGPTAPDCVFLSPPCKGLSGLLSAAQASQPEYERLNRLVFQGLFLLCETWPAGPPATIVLENVPRIVSRGRWLLHEAKSLLLRYGYRLHDSTHECGAIGGLAQKRRRYLLVARREDAVPAFIYKPPLHRIRGCGEVLGALPLPVAELGVAAGPMHALPKLSWLTWVRLALIPPGGDWRDLPGVVQAGHQRRSVWARNDVREWEQPARTVAGEGTNGGFGVADPRLPLGDTSNPNRHRNQMRVSDWEVATNTVTGSTRPGSGAPSVADPRIALAEGRDVTRGGAYGVNDWSAPSPTITGMLRVTGSNTPASVADPRVKETGAWRGSLGVTDWDEPSPTVRGKSIVRTSPASVADPRLAEAVKLGKTADGAHTFAGRPGLMGVNDWNEPTRAVTATGTVSSSNAAAAVADPRNGRFGVIDWREAAGTVCGESYPTNGKFAVADPRATPAAPPVIRSQWDCWHRPMSTLELATLQGLPAMLDGAPLVLEGKAVGRWRERIGNAVPVGAAKAIAESILLALLAGSLGTWTLGGTGIWVRNDGRSEHEWRAEL